MSQSLAIQLNQKSDSQLFTINEGDIVRTYPNVDGDTAVDVYTGGAAIKQYIVEQTPAAVAGLAASLIETTVGSVTVYINLDRIKLLDDTSGSLKISFKPKDEASYNTILDVDDTKQEIESRMFVAAGGSSFAIEAFDNGGATITIEAGEGDVSASFPANKYFSVSGHGTNDGTYQITGVATPSAAPTVLTVTVAPPTTVASGADGVALVK